MLTCPGKPSCLFVNLFSDGNIVHDHVGNTVTSCAPETIDVMQVSCTDSDKSPTTSSYDLPVDSSEQLSAVSALHFFIFCAISFEF